MKRHSYATSQMQHMSAQITMQHNAAMNNFPVEEDPTFKSSKMEGQWQWDRDASKLPYQMPSHAFNQVQGVNATRSYYQGQAVDSLENSANKGNKAQSQEQDMKIGYEDNPPPMTFESLERKFHDEIMKLVKEQFDAEDTEIARHKEKIIEINTRYQEKMSALRAQQASRREEFLHKESQTRLHQYQQAGIRSHPNFGLQDARGYGGTAIAAAAASGETHSYTNGPFESYRDRSHFADGGRTQGSEVRVPYPEGCVYNPSARYY